MRICRGRGALKSSLVLLFSLLFTSCNTTKNVAYFQDINPEGNTLLANASKFTEPTVLADDLLSISVFTIDPVTNMVINQTASQAIGVVTNANVALGSTPPVAGFLVDKNGEVDLAVIGKVKVVGLTTFQARDLIKEKASRVYANPNVQVRFANFKVTVLGEVAHPASYVLPNERVSVLDAIGLAGDLTIFGKRENITLIRDIDGRKEFAKLNLTSKEVFNSPYFYLKQNDVIYVEPNKGKAASLNQARTQTYALIGSLISVLVVVFTRL